VECAQTVCERLRRRGVEEAHQGDGWRLGACDVRQRCRSADQGNELASPHGLVVLRTRPHVTTPLREKLLCLQQIWQSNGRDESKRESHLYGRMSAFAGCGHSEATTPCLQGYLIPPAAASRGAWCCIPAWARRPKLAGGSIPRRRPFWAGPAVVVVVVAAVVGPLAASLRLPAAPIRGPFRSE
jgi:hypothetical protein